MKATGAFVIVFLLITPQSRALIQTWMGGAGNWVTAWAPLSYLIVGFVIAAPVAALLLMMKWPKPVEPENPLARYKHEDVVE
jgi:hypothetical protein